VCGLSKSTVCGDRWKLKLADISLYIMMFKLGLSFPSRIISGTLLSSKSKLLSSTLIGIQNFQLYNLLDITQTLE
jgi:hypothetical protein